MENDRNAAQSSNGLPGLSRNNGGGVVVGSSAGSSANVPTASASIRSSTLSTGSTSITFDMLVNLLAGGLGGTVAAIVTCPLEVVKTRQQSSVAAFSTVISHNHNQTSPHTSQLNASAIQTNQHTSQSSIARRPPRFLLTRCIRDIISREGYRALFKGLGPNLVGVFPSRAIYFCAYSQAKTFFNEVYPVRDTAWVHMSAAATAGFVSSTSTNPIWFVKTRMQLDQSHWGGHITAWRCIKGIYRTKGIKGFYKGITASYFGISETMMHFVIFEYIKQRLKDLRLSSSSSSSSSKTNSDKNNNNLKSASSAISQENQDYYDGDDYNQNCSEFDDDDNQCTHQSSHYPWADVLVAGSISKTTASIIAYPHEVVRTRLRQEGDKYRKFWQTLGLVWKEEGRAGMYRGLGTQLVRQIPNTAIMLTTYELIIFLVNEYQLEARHKQLLEERAGGLQRAATQLAANVQEHRHHHIHHEHDSRHSPAAQRSHDSY